MRQSKFPNFNATSNWHLLPLVTLALHLIPLGEGANILFYFALSSYSHRVPAWPLAEALVERDHNVTFLSSYPGKNPNPKINDFVPPASQTWLKDWSKLENFFEDRKRGDWINTWTKMGVFGLQICQNLLDDPEFVKWVKGSKFDLIFLNSAFNDCALGFASVWGPETKIILFDTTTVYSHHYDAYGIPDQSSWIPMMEPHYPVGMSLRQRMVNAIVPLVWDFYRKWFFLPELQKMAQDKLEIAASPSFLELEQKTSLFFVNTHFSEEFPRALPPNVVPVGGIAFTGKKKPLPKELEEFLSKGKKGFIYMSFGTYADFQRFDPDVKEAFIGALRSFPEIQFVWTVANTSLAEEFPEKNVYVSKWNPQQDLLGHPKILAFITHSGLVSLQESISYAVPMISFPCFAEQNYNAERIQRKETGIVLEVTTVTKGQLVDAINKILTEPK